MTNVADEGVDMDALADELNTIKRARKRVIRDLANGQIRSEEAAGLLDVLFDEERKVQEAIIAGHWDRQTDG